MDGPEDKKTSEQEPDTILCPACGKDSENKEGKCSECGGRLSYRVKETTLIKFVAIFLVLGLILLALATMWEMDTTDIEDLGEDDNFTIKRVKGVVTGPPSYTVSEYQEYGEMRFYINDTTGEIQVFCKSETTKELIEEGKIPSVGDTVEVEGRVLYIESFLEEDGDVTISEEGLKFYSSGEVKKTAKGAFKRVTVSSKYNIRIGSNKYKQIPISEDEFEEGKKVKMSGTVLSDVVNYTTAYQFTLGDLETGNKLLVYVPKDLVELSGVELYSEDDKVFQLRQGAEVTILGALEYYESDYGPQYNKWELIPTSLGDKIKVSGEVCFQVEKEGRGFSVDRLISNSAMFEDELVYLEGVKVSQSDKWLYVKDPGGTNEIQIFSYESLGNFSVGDEVNVKGEFIKYQERWEIKLSKDYHYIEEAK